MLTQIKSFWQHSKFKYFFTAFCLVGVILLINLLLSRPNQKFEFDSWGYYEVAGTFWETPLTFKFTNFHCVPRGYFWPFLIAMSTYPGRIFHFNQTDSFLIIQQFFYALFLTVIIPKFFIRFFAKNKKINWLTTVKIIIFFCLVFYFWRGMFLQALTDFPALFFLIIALYSFGFFLNQASHCCLFSSIFGLVTGFFLTAAYYTRPSFLMSYLFFILIFFIYLLLNKHKRFFYIFFITFIIGSFLVVLPQILINHKYYNQYTPFVQTALEDNPAISSIMLRQLSWGLTMQKYETSISNDYPTNGVQFEDKTGVQILANEQPLVIDNYAKYFSLVLKYPLDIIAVYTRHFFNGLDIKYPEIYITSVYKDSTIISFINYSLIFLFLLYLIHCAWFNFPRLSKSEKKSYISQCCSTLFLNNQKIWLSIILLASIPPAILGAIEVRFMLPLFILIYGTIIFTIPYQQLWQKICQRPWLHMFFYLIFVLLCFTWSSNTMSNLRLQEPILINDKSLNSLENYSVATESAHAN